MATKSRSTGHSIPRAALVAFAVAIATSIVGVTLAQAQAPGLGPTRGYEVVSHLPTGGVPIDPLNTDAAVSPIGDRVTFATRQALPGSTIFLEDEGDAVRPWRYVSERHPAGWGIKEIGLKLTVGQGGGPSADASRFLAGTRLGLDPDDQNDRNDLYLRHPDGSIVWVTRDPRIAAGTPQTSFNRIEAPTRTATTGGMSEDGRTVVFSAIQPLDDADTAPPADEYRLYKWSDGELTFIGVRPDGSVPALSALGTSISHDHYARGNGSSGANLNNHNAVSRDGSRVIFSAYRTDISNFDGKGGTIYVQIDGEPTVEAVKETGVPALPADQPFAPIYRGASSDASRVFYTTSSRLTPDSGAEGVYEGAADLYVYDVEEDKVVDVTPRLDVGGDPSVVPAAADQARVQGVAAVSEDGRRVYFVANGAYPTASSPEGDLPVDGSPNLYLAELGDDVDDPVELSFVATLGAGDFKVWQAALVAGLEAKRAYASPDGSVLGFGSSEELTGDPLGGTAQLFVYDAREAALDCASCPSDGSAPTSNVNPAPTGLLDISEDPWQPQETPKQWISADHRVFFYTATRLVAGDRNEVNDVYEYRDGGVRLVSAGASNRPSYLENVSRDASTVLFTTSDALAPQDSEPGIPKLYAARVGGGFAAALAPAPVCEGEECRANPPASPGGESPGSKEQEGAGNVDTATPSCAKQKKQLSRADKQVSKLAKKAKNVRGKKARKQARQKLKRARTKAARLDRKLDRCRSGEGR